VPHADGPRLAVAGKADRAVCHAGTPRLGRDRLAREAAPTCSGDIHDWPPEQQRGSETIGRARKDVTPRMHRGPVGFVLFARVRQRVVPFFARGASTIIRAQAWHDVAAQVTQRAHGAR
jgi:hypothetical protein